MKRYIILLLSVIMMIIISVSCSKAEPDDTVRIWMYKYMYCYGDTELKDKIENEVINYAKENNIIKTLMNL